MIKEFDLTFGQFALQVALTNIMIGLWLSQDLYFILNYKLNDYYQILAKSKNYFKIFKISNIWISEKLQMFMKY